MTADVVDNDKSGLNEQSFSNMRGFLELIRTYVCKRVILVTYGSCMQPTNLSPGYAWGPFFYQEINYLKVVPIELKFSAKVVAGKNSLIKSFFTIYSFIDFEMHHYTKNAYVR